MTTFLPYRANVFCSLGHLIDGQFADTYLQQAGLIFCRGSVRLAGIVRPDVGTVVSFAYTRNNVTAARIPRVLRVLSSFADPFTNITTVQLGCKLTLLQNSRQPDAATPEESDPILNPGVGLNIDAKEFVAPPVGALAAAQKCLAKLGITAAAPLPLLNRYTVDNVDLSEGYVSVLGKLLESELYVGWLNEAEELEVRNLQIDTDALGPVINNTNVFTLSPIGVGELPAEFVNVTFTPLGLRSASVNESGTGASERMSDISGWTSSVTTGFPVVYRIDYTAGDAPQSFVGTYIPVQKNTSTFSSGLMTRSVSESLKPYAAVAGKYASQALSNGLDVPTTATLATSTTLNRYDSEGRVTTNTVIEEVSLAEFAGKLDLTFVFSDSDFVIIPPAGEVVAGKTVTKYSYNGNAVRREVSRYTNWALTQNGQQSINESRSSIQTSGDVANFINALLGEPAYEGTEVTVTNSGPQVQRLPGPAALAEQSYGRGQRTEQTVSSAFEFGAVDAQRIATFTLPYTSDDYFSNVVLGQWITVDQSARRKSLALNYGRIQNRLRLGNSQGVSLQIPVELLPVKPFDAIYLQAGGLTGQYRANGMSWTFDQNGIVGQVDALFWLAIGQTGTPGPVWFPTAPGVTALPTTPGPTVNTTPAPANSGNVPGGWDPADPDLDELFGELPTGEPPVFPSELDVPTGLEPFAETVELEAVTRAVFEIEDFPYSLTLEEEDMDLVSRAVFDVQEIALAIVPRADLRLTPQVPFAYAPALVTVPRADFRLVPQVPTVAGAAYVRAPRVDLRLAPTVPTAGSQGLFVALRADFRLVPQLPTVIGGEDYGAMKLALLFEGTDGSTTFVDSGANAATITAFNSATITTSTFAQGAASGNFIRSSASYLTVSSLAALNFGTGNYRIRFRARFATLPTGTQTYTVVQARATFDNTAMRINFVVASGAITLRYSRPWAGFVVTSSTLSLATNTWYEFEVQRSGTSVALRQGGASIGSGTDSAVSNLGAGGTSIGGVDATNNFDGQLDELLVE